MTRIENNYNREKHIQKEKYIDFQSAITRANLSVPFEYKLLLFDLN